MAEEQSWAVKWLMSRVPTEEQTAVVTMAASTLDEIQDQHEERRKELTAYLERRRDAINAQDYSLFHNDVTAQQNARLADLKSAEDAYAKALARLDARSAAIQDVQRIVVRR